MYKINNIEYNLKALYTLKDWGKILKLLAPVEGKSVDASAIALVAEGTLDELLNIILDKPLQSDLSENDLDAVTAAISDFFSRKSGLINSAKNFLQK